MTAVLDLLQDRGLLTYQVSQVDLKKGGVCRYWNVRDAAKISTVKFYKTTPSFDASTRRKIFRNLAPTPYDLILISTHKGLFLDDSLPENLGGRVMAVITLKTL